MLEEAETFSGNFNPAGPGKHFLVRGTPVMKSTLLLVAVAAWCSSATVQAQRNSEDCSDGSCDLNQRSDRSQRRYIAANDDEQWYNNDRLSEADRRNSQPVPTYFQPTSYESSRTGSQAINWNPNIRNAVNQAAQQKRPILVQVSARWCPQCIRMKEETYTNRKLTSLISERFVAISVDADQQRDFIEQMGIQSLPTTLIVASDLQVLNRLEGFQSADQLLQLLSR